MNRLYGVIRGCENYEIVLSLILLETLKWKALKWNQIGRQKRQQCVEI